MCRSFLFNLSDNLNLPHLILCCLDLFVSPLSNPLNTMCCLAPISSTITVISSSKELDFFSAGPWPLLIKPSFVLALYKRKSQGR